MRLSTAQSFRTLRADAGCSIPRRGLCRRRALLRQCESLPPGAFVETRNLFRRNFDLVAPDSISKEEVIDETIAAALGDGRRQRQTISTSQSGSPSSPGSTAWPTRMPSMNFPDPTEATAAPCTWKIQPASRTSRPATNPNCNSISPTKPSPKNRHRRRAATPERDRRLR